ncbi:hypothetical protein PIB30_066839, partial [Stylosanthes scabra]|nr:hypothetical protein [Stylosanthes scabra]
SSSGVIPLVPISTTISQSKQEHATIPYHHSTLEKADPIPVAPLVESPATFSSQSLSTPTTTHDIVPNQ